MEKPPLYSLCIMILPHLKHPCPLCHYFPFPLLLLCAVGLQILGILGMPSGQDGHQDSCLCYMQERWMWAIVHGSEWFLAVTNSAGAESLAQQFSTKVPWQPGMS